MIPEPNPLALTSEVINVLQGTESTLALSVLISAILTVIWQTAPQQGELIAKQVGQQIADEYKSVAILLADQTVPARLN